MPTALPATTDWTGASQTEGGFKLAQSNLRDYLASLLGATGMPTEALTNLGVIGSRVITKTAAYTLTAADKGAVFRFDAAAAGATISLPDATANSAYVAVIINNTGGSLILDPYLTQTINVAPTATMSSGDVWLIISDGSNYVTVGMASGGRQIQPVTSSVAGNAATLTLNQTTLDFRSATLADGTVNTRAISSALSIVIPSGATLGFINGQPGRIALLALDIGSGTVELAVSNLAGNSLDETKLISTTAISASATSNSVIYSNAARTNVPFRIVGIFDFTQTTAGQWAADATLKQGAGGDALKHVGAIQRSAALALSGAATDITGIPDWVNRITVTATGASGSSSSYQMSLQVGAGSIVSSGYTGYTTVAANGFALSASGITQSASFAFAITLYRVSGNTWIMVGGNATDNTTGVGNASWGIAEIALSGPLDRVRLMVSVGNWDAGTVVVTWE